MGVSTVKGHLGGTCDSLAQDPGLIERWPAPALLLPVL